MKDTVIETVDRFVGEAECRRRTNLSRVTRWRGVRAGWFPAPVQIAPNRKAWLDSQITAWLRDRAAGITPEGMAIKASPRGRDAITPQSSSPAPEAA